MTNVTGSLGLGATFATTSIDGLKDFFGFSGVSAGEGLGAGIDVAYGPGLDPIQITASVTASGNLPIPGEFHSGGSWTWIMPPSMPPLGPLATYESFADAVFAGQELADVVSELLP